MSDVIVSLKNLWKTFNKGGQQINVLCGINLDIHAGERISIVGKSGSGKSTLLHILGALDVPTKGGLNIRTADGEIPRNIFDLPNHKVDSIRNLLVGFIFQFHHLLPDHNAVGNVMMPLVIKGERKSIAEKKAKEILKRVGLENRFTHRPGELSGGEQQRVAIARALIHRPRLLLADEPTGNLDPKTSSEIMELLIGLQEDVTGAMIMVTHDHTLAKLCEKRFDLKNGLLEALT
jgi:lipoprotein-releasing system ATP-binding protein